MASLAGRVDELRRSVLAESDERVKEEEERRIAVSSPRYAPGTQVTIAQQSAPYMRFAGQSFVVGKLPSGVLAYERNRMMLSAIADAQSTRSVIGTCSLGRCAARTSPGPKMTVGMPPTRSSRPRSHP